MDSCIFCNIIRKDIPAHLEYENEWVVAFNDIAKKAPLHILVVPRIHVPSLHDPMAVKSNVYEKLLSAVVVLVDKLKLFNDGYRLVVNCGDNAHQSVAHLHIHLLAGDDLGIAP